jgi:hypothetical protein
MQIGSCFPKFDFIMDFWLGKKFALKIENPTSQQHEKDM